MPKQVETFDEMDNLRDQIRIYKEADEGMKEMLLAERQKVAELEAAKNNIVREPGFIDDFRPEPLMLIATCAA